MDIGCIGCNIYISISINLLNIEAILNFFSKNDPNFNNVLLDGILSERYIDAILLILARSRVIRIRRDPYADRRRFLE